MSIHFYTGNLAKSELETLTALDASGDYLGAFKSLVVEGHYNEAYQYGLNHQLYTEVALLAASQNDLDAVKSACAGTNPMQLGDRLMAKNFPLAASVCYEKAKAFEKAARACLKAQDYAHAAELFEAIEQFMDAIMCCQKSGNMKKQLDLQVAAFRHDLALADGDMSAVSVSRMMAIASARVFMEDPETCQKGLDILEETDTIQSMADEYEKSGKYHHAAMCAARMGDYVRALSLFNDANEASHAIKMAKLSGDQELVYRELFKHKRYLSLAKEFISQKRLNDALEALKRIDGSDPTYSDAIELQGDVYVRQKLFENATVCYDMLLTTNLPQDRLCRITYKVAYSYEMKGDLEHAHECYQHVYDIDPNFHGIADALKHILERLEEQRAIVQPAALLPPPAAPGVPTHSQGVVLRRPPSASIETPRVNSLIIESASIPSLGNERYGNFVEVAHGGMGVVYKATDNILMRTVALKVLSQKLKDNEVALEYFMREARASAALQHINIVTVYDIGSFQDGTIYLAMEFIDGKTLKQLVTMTGPFPTKFLVQLSIHACRGLQYAHDHGIVHRDIKSSNLMLTKKDKTLKILDFGLAKVINELDKNSTQAIGTPYYMSPEQIQGTEIDSRSDIYSLGITLFELATGALPFTKGDLSYKHVHEEPPMPSSINPKIDPELEKIILKMLKKRPDDRFDSCSAVAQALKAVRF